MVHKNYLYKKAIRLRKDGNSYMEINRSLGIAKSTLSLWFAEKSWSIKLRSKLLKSYKENSRIGLVFANLERIKRKEERHKTFISDAKSEFMKLMKDPLFLVGLSIYWGEGDKSNQGRVSVVNTDPELILTIKMFYERCLNISIEKLRVGLFVYRDLDVIFVKNYWSDKLNIPTKQFIKTQILESRSKLTKNKSKYGVCSLYFSSTEFSIKIREWIKLLWNCMRD